VKTLKDALLEHPPQLLRAIADMNHVTLPDGGTRDQWAALLADELARPEVVERAWQSLASPERAALDNLMLKGGKAKAFQILRDHGEIRAFGPVALARDKPWLKPANVIEGLWYRGMIQRAFDVVGEFRGEIFFIPAEIMPHLPKPTAETAGFVAKGTPPPDSISDQGDSLMWDMFGLLVFVSRAEPRYEEHGLLSEVDRRAWAARLLVPEPGSENQAASGLRTGLILRLARTARLIRPINEVGLRLGSESRAWLRSTRQECRLRVFDAWKQERAWSELNCVPTIKPEETGWHNDPRLAREVVLRFLAQCPPLKWISLPSFIAAIKKADPDFQRPDGDYDRWHIRAVSTGRLLAGFQHWNDVEGALIAFMFEGPLCWLGIVSVGGKVGEPAAFRIGEFGAHALGLSANDLPEPAPERFVVQADFEVLVPAGAPMYARFQLERMADLQRWDRMSTYRLTRESLTHLLRHNVTIGQLMSFLKRISREPFPKNVEFTLRDWATKYGEITLRHTAILHTRDRHLLIELQRRPEVRPFIIEVLSPTVALVAPDRFEELRARLEALGYSPRIESIDTQTPGS
jgi:Helicase conserved C-terminal domain